jgi:hypothetical protein
MAGDWPGVLQLGRALHAVAPRPRPRRNTCRVCPTHAGAALDAVVAALPRDSKRQLRAACRAGRAAVDSRTAAIVTPLGASPRGLPAAVARMPRLRSLDCCISHEVDCAELAGALGGAPASLAALRYQGRFNATSGDGTGPSRSIADAIGLRPCLVDLELELCPSAALCAAFVAAVGRLPRLRTLRLRAAIRSDADDPWHGAPPELALPSTLQASALWLSMPRG